MIEYVPQIHLKPIRWRRSRRPRRSGSIAKQSSAEEHRQHTQASLVHGRRAHGGVVLVVRIPAAVVTVGITVGVVVVVVAGRLARQSRRGSVGEVSAAAEEIAVLCVLVADAVEQVSAGLALGETVEAAAVVVALDLGVFAALVHDVGVFVGGGDQTAGDVLDREDPGVAGAGGCGGGGSCGRHFVVNECRWRDKGTKDAMRWMRWMRCNKQMMR